ncbi:carboxypeptidase-like regulatory domain-containing protein [Granulicella sp. L46]|uniref:carboxypeptidase-like regulatory domain-containing protein n=1 Tax=Granulicella sp. L46 TaxID=1641865 RepID=UPI00131DC253|nr:carboxypeptidase-like regulatory domain-containing protein [Granulicella sp. L46]
MNVYETSAEAFHSHAIALLRAQQTRQWLLDAEKSRERNPRTSHIRAVADRFRSAGTVIAILVVLLCSSRCFGQSTFGSIRGTVEDVSGAAVPDAQVRLHSIDENTDRVVTTDAAGAYTLENVNAGKYKIVGERAGFADSVVDGISLAARQDLRFALTMKIAAQTTTVEVSAAAAEINTENATLVHSLNTGEIGQLPLNFRATTTSPLAALAASPDVQQDTSGNFEVGGATTGMVGFSVDGVSTVNVFQSGVSLAVGALGSNPYPSSEGISELKVTGFDNNAEFSQVADVTFTTKPGTNQFHGSLFEYLQNDALNAKVYDFAVKSPERFNTFGGSVGGPVSIPRLYNGHNKTFFFFDYEGNRKSTSTAEQYDVPSMQDRLGNLNDIASTFPILNPGPAGSTTNPNGLPIVNPNCAIGMPCIINPATGSLETGQPFANNTITTPLSQSSLTLLNDYYPLPNATNLGGGLNYQTLVPVPSRTNGFDGRIDQVISSKQQMFVRYNWKNLLVNTVNNLLPDDVDTEHDRSFLVSHSYEFTPTLINEFRYGFTHSILSPDFPIEGAQAIAQLGLQGIDVSNHPTDGGFPSIFFNDGTSFTPIGRDHVGPTVSSTYELADNLTWTRGRHTVRGGVDIRWVRFQVPEIETPSDDYGLISFNQNIFTGSSFGDLLLGIPNTTYFAVTGPANDAGGRQYGFYAQDEWQVNKRLTINYGLRWELLPPFVDVNGQQANFDPNTNSVIVNSNLYGRNGGPVLAFLQSFNACNASIPGHTATADPGYTPSSALPCTPVVSNEQEGLPPGLRQTYMRNFDPRISFAYRPFGDDRTVLRAGFGIFTVTALGQLQNNNESNPVASVYTYTNINAAGAPSFAFPQVTPPGVAGQAQIGGGELEQATDPRYRDVQTAQWNVTVERELTSNTALRASYVGMSSYRLNVTANLNQQLPTTVPVGQPNPNPIPFPNWGTIFQTANLGHQNYEALQLQATHRMGKGLSYQANYTWAHDLSDAQGDAPTAFQGETRYGLADEDRFNIKGNRGNVVGTRRNRFLLTGTYELPYGRGRQWSSHSTVVDYILGGWNVNTITLLESGPYLTPTMSVADDQTNTDPAAAGIAVVRPDRVGNPIPAHRTNADYFNIAAFAPPPAGAGRVGNAAVGSLEGPGTIAVAAGLAKIIPIHGNVNLRFESTFTNVLNHTNFAPPQTDISNTSSFGALTTAQTAESAGNRTGQVALRLVF